MSSLHLWAVFSAILTLFLFHWAMPNRRFQSVTVGKYTITLLFLTALLVRIHLAARSTGFNADINCFSSWADRMVLLGPGKFYEENYFSDYPPLYLYFLWLIGWIRTLFSLDNFSPAHLVLLKMPSILADLGIGYLIYRIGRKHLGILSGLALTSIYLFHPAVLLNSCLWGQIDSLFTLLLLSVCILLEKDKLFPAYLLYCTGVLLKPQMLIFAPLILINMLHYIFHGRFSSKRLLQTVGYGLLSLLLTVLAATPFGLDKVIKQYLDTLGSYPYASVNAYNFWSFVGLNWFPQDTAFLGISCVTWGFAAIVLAVLFCVLIGYCFRQTSGRYALMGAFLILTVFTFSVRMHERYLYPVMALLLAAFPGLSARQLCGGISRDKSGDGLILTRSLRCGLPALFTALACLHLYNTGHVLYFYDPSNYSADAVILRATGLGMTLCALLFYILLFDLSRRKAGITAPSARELRKTGESARLHFSSWQEKITRWDLLILCLITLFYSVFALRDLGNTKAPKTVYEASEGRTMYFDFAPSEPAAYLSYYIAPEHNRVFQFQFEGVKNDADTPSGDDCILTEEYTLENVFTWNTIHFPAESRRLSMTLQYGSAHIVELVFLDADQNPVTPLNADDYPELFDEAHLYPDRFSFRNSMYFDEIYHARTAYEFLHDMRSYENTHPPLGKILIALGVSLFGMNPFGWRIVGVLFGIAMLPVLYLFAKRLTGYTPTAALTCWIFAFDFMHFAQTRIATIDVYIVFFIICMYYFLYRFLTADYWASGRKLFLPLALCGLFMGFGVACKWTGVYAGIGMGILFFVHLALLAEMYFQAKKNPGGKTGTYSNRDILSVFPGRTRQVILFCIFFFVLVPGLIYLLSYLPFRDGSSSGLFVRMWGNQKTMFNYHSKLNATHYFASPYYEWPLLVRPIWYYSGKLSPTLREGISSFGNPLVWWTGIPAFLYMVYLYLKKKDKNAFFLLVGYLAQYIPWFFVTRITFIYHYFPSVVFVVLMIGYGARCLLRKASRRMTLAVLLLYGAAVFGLFLLFYPVLSGQPVELAFAEKYLKWFKTWVLVAG